MNIGFTGSRAGMTGDQAAAVARLFIQLRDEADIPDIELWHGDCIGADEQAEELARMVGILTRAFPGPIEEKRANTPSTYRAAPAHDNLVRNRRIALACDPIVAAPSTPEIVRSGTWATVRYARDAGKTVYIVSRDGTIEKEEGQL